MRKNKNFAPKSLRGKAEFLSKQLDTTLPAAKDSKVTNVALAKNATKIVDAGLGNPVSNGLKRPDGWPNVLADGVVIAPARETKAIKAAKENDPAAQMEDAEDGVDQTFDSAEETADAEEIPAPPAAWSEDAKAEFDTLPDVVKQAITAHEKTMQAKLAADQQGFAERLGQVDATLGAVLNHAVDVDPIIKEGITTDWHALAQTHPQIYAAKWPPFQQKMAMLNALAAKRSEAQNAHAQYKMGIEKQALHSKLPDWQDAEKQKQMFELWGRHAGAWGYKPEDLAHVNDHRLVLMALDAAKYLDGKKTMNSLPAKRVGQIHASVPGSLKPGGGQKPARTGGLEQQKAEALRSGSLRKQADYILRVLQSGK